MIGLGIKLLLILATYFNVERVNEGIIEDFAYNVPIFLLQKACGVCLILLPTYLSATESIAQSQPENI